MDQTTVSQLQAAAAANQDQQPQAPASGTMPLDVTLFLQLFPILLQGTIQRSANSGDAISAAMVGAREALGQYVTMGLLFPQTRLPDGSLLAKVPGMPMGQAQALPQGVVGAPSGHNPGNFVGQFPTVPSQPVRTT